MWDTKKTTVTVYATYDIVVVTLQITVYTSIFVIMADHDNPN
jgi:hypothetical protein